MLDPRMYQQRLLPRPALRRAGEAPGRGHRQPQRHDHRPLLRRRLGDPGRRLRPAPPQGPAPPGQGRRAATTRRRSRRSSTSSTRPRRLPLDAQPGGAGALRAGLLPPEGRPVEARTSPRPPSPSRLRRSPSEIDSVIQPQPASGVLAMSSATHEPAASTTATSSSSSSTSRTATPTATPTPATPRGSTPRPARGSSPTSA